MMTRTDRMQLSDLFRWAIELEGNPADAAADWLARDIDPNQSSAIGLVSSRDVPLQHLKQAKEVYKTMRMIGETTADRRAGGRLYLAAIAAALVYHDTRISRQSDPALVRALNNMLEDREAPDPLRQLAGAALSKLRLDEESPPSARINVEEDGEQVT